MIQDFKHAWTAETFTSDDPLRPLHWVCEGLKHDNHKFARRIFVNKVIITRNGVVEELKHDDFKVVNFDAIIKDNVIQPGYTDLFEYGYSREREKLNISEPLDKVKAIRNIYMQRHNFDSYGVEGMVHCYEHRKTEDAPPLFVFTSLSFGEYGHKPPHEFSGMLNAARFMPTIWFATLDETISSIRFDYRFELDLDEWIMDKQTYEMLGFSSLFPDSPPPNFEPVNYASIIRDADTLPFASCFNDLIRLVQEFSKTYQALAQEVVVFVELSSHLMSTIISGKLDDLAKSVENIKNLSATLLKLGRKIRAAFREIPGCLWKDLKGTIKDAMTVLIEEGALLAEKIITLFKSIGKLLLNYLRILGKISEEVVDALVTVGELIWDPLEYDRILEQRRQRHNRTVKQIQKLQAENNVLWTMLKYDAVEVFDQFVFIAGKIFNYVSFEAAEKPVCFEIVGNFLDRGEVDHTWDNLHWWGTSYLPSAPGAFNAIHQHFRWSKFLGEPSPTEELANDALFWILGGGAEPDKSEATRRPFRSLVKAFQGSKIGGPLIDPGLPDQTIQFALALRDGKLDKAILDIAPTDDFVEVAKAIQTPGETAKETLQTGNEEYFKGSDIVYWLSLQARRNDSGTIFRGSLLINGFYFAHSPEPEASFFGDTPTNFAAITKGTSIFNPPYDPPVKLLRKPN